VSIGERVGVFSGEGFIFLARLVVESLPPVQRIILKEIDGENANQLVNKIMKKYGVSRSTVWYNLWQLKKRKIIYFEKGMPVFLNLPILKEVCKEMD